MAPIGVGRNTKTPYPDLNDEQKKKIRDRIKGGGTWTKELSGSRVAMPASRSSIQTRANSLVAEPL